VHLVILNAKKPELVLFKIRVVKKIGGAFTKAPPGLLVFVEYAS